METVMQKGMGTAIAVWVAAIASAVVVIRQVEHPMRGTPAAGGEVRAGAMTATRQSDVSQAGLGEDDDGYDVALPGDTIVGHVRGVAVMQRQDDLIIGPGIVTHPAAEPVRRNPVTPDGEQ
jgi:hypothetical protein